MASVGGIRTALMLPAALTLLSAIACAIWIVDPHHTKKAGHSPAPTANPYRNSATLWRIHLVSALLVVPQFTVSTFGLVWLVAGWRWSTTAASVLVGACQIVGAFGRIGVGMLSDRVGSRLGPLRWLAYTAVAEIAGPTWSGRALGAQNTGQFLAA